MKVFLKFILFISFFHCGGVMAQQGEDQKKIEMIKFLLNQKALTNTNSAISSYEDAIYDRAIFKNKRHLKVNTIYIFGSNSAHSKKYVGLEDFTGLKLLETKDLPTDMKAIVPFLKRNKVKGEEVFKLLLEIADTYEYNSKMNLLPVLDTH